MADAPVVGQMIRRARERKRWTQKRLAEEIGGVSFKTIGNWERGVTFPRSAVGRIEEVLGISLTANGTPQPPTDPRERELYDLLLQRIDDMTPAEALAIIEDDRRRREGRRRTA